MTLVGKGKPPGGEGRVASDEEADQGEAGNAAIVSACLNSF